MEASAKQGEESGKRMITGQIELKTFCHRDFQFSQDDRNSEVE
jgi:hypothetical protein